MSKDPPLKGLRVLELAGLAPGQTYPLTSLSGAGGLGGEAEPAGAGLVSNKNSQSSLTLPSSPLAPFCGLLLASYGASVLRIDRPHPLAHPPPPPPSPNRQSTSVSTSPPTTTTTNAADSPPPSALPPATGDLLTAHKSSICLDLKSEASRGLLLDLIPHTDILIDPFRPGVLESVDLDPEAVLRKANPRLIVARLTGFRRDGKYASMAGHDINYLAVSGILSLLGGGAAATKATQPPPQPPGNILADFAGGGLVAFTGILLALVRKAVTGQGQVVEANMVDGVGFLATFPRLATKTPLWSGARGTNLLDGGAPFYRCYETKDDGGGGPGYVAVGALEPRFFAELLDGLGLTEEDVLPPRLCGGEGEGEGGRGRRGGTLLHDRQDKAAWPHMTDVLARRFRQKTRTEWEDVFDGTDACVTPVLTMAELERHRYQQRPLVGLTESPARHIIDPWTPRPLRPGQGGEHTLHSWLGWKRGQDFGVERGALVRLHRPPRSKL